MKKTVNKKGGEEKTAASHYTVWDGTRGGKTFGTLNEAVNYSNEVLRKSGIVTAVTATDKRVTHTYTLTTKKR